MATNAGTIFVSIQARIDKFKKQIDVAQTRLQKFSAGTTNFVKQNRLAITGAVVGIGALVLKVTKAASDLEETQAKFNTVFRGSITEAESFATELQKNYLLSETSAKTFLASIQDTLVPMGLAREAATQLSGDVIKLAADLGSFNNVPTAIVVRDLQSALVGNTETVKKYGIVLRATDIQQRALANTGKSLAKELTQADKVQASLNLVMEGSADAIGDVSRTSQSYANRLKFLQSQLTNLSTTVGGLVIGPMTDFVNKFSEWIQILNDAVTQLQGFKKEGESILDFIASNFILVLTAVLDSVIEVFRVVTEGILNFTEKIPGVSALIQKLGGDTASLADVTKSYVGVVERAQNRINEFGISLQNTLKDGQESAAGLVTAEEDKQEAIQETGRISNEELVRLSEARIEAQKQALKDEEKAQKEALKISEKFRIDRKKTAEKEADEVKARAERIRDVFVTTNEEWTSFAINVAEQMFDTLGSGFADMILEGRKFSDVFKELWKGIARAIIAEIAKMIAKLLVFLALRAATGGAFGGGGFAKFAGFGAEGALINEPSIVTGLKSGRTIVAGEAGPEAIVPVAPNGRSQNALAPGIGDTLTQTASASSGAGQNINLTFNISGQFLEGNERVWQTLIRDKIVPEIRRFTMSVPTGPFNRRRGVA